MPGMYAVCRFNDKCPLVTYTIAQGVRQASTPGQKCSRRARKRQYDRCRTDLPDLSYFCRTGAENADVVDKNGGVGQLSSSNDEKVGQMSSRDAARSGV
jgi:hypothetical protein